MIISPLYLVLYMFRVGRTARAGCGGRAVTLVGESRRIVMKVGKTALQS